MGEHDAGKVGRESRAVESVADPCGGVGIVLAPEQGAGEDDRLFEDERFRGEEDLQVGRELLLLADKKRLLPQAAGATVVVVARNDDDGHLHLSDGFTGHGHGGLARARAVEEVAGDQDEGCLLVADDGGDAFQAFEALVLEAAAVIFVEHAGIGFAKLPVGGVDEGDCHDGKGVRSKVEVQ